MNPNNAAVAFCDTDPDGTFTESADERFAHARPTAAARALARTVPSQ